MRQFTLVVGFAAAFLGTPSLHAAERQLATLQGLSAVVQDGFCRSNVMVRVLAPDVSEFSGDKIKLQRLIGALRIPLGMECPTAKEFLISGRVGGKEVYLGSIAEANDWMLKDRPELLQAYQSVGQFTDKYLKEKNQEIKDLDRKIASKNAEKAQILSQKTDEIKLSDQPVQKTESPKSALKTLEESLQKDIEKLDSEIEVQKRIQGEQKRIIVEQNRIKGEQKSIIDAENKKIKMYNEIKQIEDSYVRNNAYGQEYFANCQRYYTEAKFGGERTRCIKRGVDLLSLKLGEESASARNYNEAVTWFHKAAENGNAEAQYKLAVMLDKGYGVQQNPQQAIDWFTRAANQGHTGAMNNIGLMYEEGRGVRQDYREAINWYSKAAERGNSMAQYNLGIVYEDGKGVSKDMGLAVQYFRMAANQGMKEAQQMLLRIERSGKIYSANQNVAPMTNRPSAINKNPSESKPNSDNDKGYGEVRRVTGLVMEYFNDYQVFDIYGQNINELAPYSVMAEKTSIAEWLEFSKDKRQQVIDMVGKEWDLIFKMTAPIYQCYAFGRHSEVKLQLQKQLVEYGLNAKERDRCIALGPGQKH